LARQRGAPEWEAAQVSWPDEGLADEGLADEGLADEGLPF
jgi:hypothetical protein